MLNCRPSLPARTRWQSFRICRRKNHGEGTKLCSSWWPVAVLACCLKRWTRSRGPLEMKLDVDPLWLPAVSVCVKGTISPWCFIVYLERWQFGAMDLFQAWRAENIKPPTLMLWVWDLANERGKDLYGIPTRYYYYCIISESLSAQLHSSQQLTAIILKRTVR